MSSSFRPYAKLWPVSNLRVRWTEGFWAEWSRVCRDVMVPNMWRLLQDDSISHAYANFRIAAGLQEGEHRGPKWHDGDFYKWLEAACHVYSTTHDAELDRLMDEIIAVIARVQRADGYIHTPVIIASRKANGSPAAEFHERLHFETYNMGHLMTTACAHYVVTGKTTLLAVARRAADFLEDYYRRAAPELARNAICPSHYMGVVDLYRTTGEPRYLELAKALVEIRSLVQGGDDNQDRLPLRAQEHVAGHAVRANYLYSGVADVYAETGDPTLLAPLEKLWDDLAAHKVYLTGGCGALYDGASPDGSTEQEQITRVHQAYGRAYQLPNATAHNETCAAIGSLLWSWRMLNLSGQARYADMLELALYNSVLAGISLDGRRFFYTNPLRKVDGLPFELRWSRTREEYISCFCCPPNVVRTIAQVGGYAYGVSPEGAWVHLYGSSETELDLPGGRRVRLRQETDYPFDGEIVITVEEAPAQPFAFHLRIPGWVQEARLRVNGEAEPERLVPGTYHRVQRRWAPGDRIRLALEMPPERIEAHPLVEELRGHLAVRRGPLIYCLEGIDLPPGASILDVYLPPDMQLIPATDPVLECLMPGIHVLRGVGLLDEAPGDWRGQLYRPARPKKLKEIELTFIPYFAWGNRGEAEMTVWLPEGNT